SGRWTVLSGQFDWGGLLNKWGALTATSKMILAVCWNIRLLADSHPLREEVKECSIRRYRHTSVKMGWVRIISREVFVTPQRLHAKHPSGMVIQSELSSDRKLLVSALAISTISVRAMSCDPTPSKA